MTKPPASSAAIGSTDTEELEANDAEPAPATGNDTAQTDHNT